MSAKKMTMKEKKKAKRVAILDAALDIFSQKGFQDTKIIEISRKADVADGTIYLYFKNKDDLFMAAFESFMQKKMKQFRDILEPIENKYERLHRFLDLHAEMFTNNPDLARFMFIELRQSPQFYNKYPNFWPLREYTEFAKQLCSDAVKAKSIRPIDPEVLVTIMIGTMDFALIEWLLGDKDKSLYDIKESILDIIHNGLRMD